MIKVKIPLKFPSLNDFISASKIQRGRWNKGYQMKEDYQQQIYYYLCKIPQIKAPAKIHFTWIEKNKRRDLDNISSVGRKFILDTLQICGKLKNDNLNYIVGFTDDVIFENEYGVIMEIEEVIR